MDENEEIKFDSPEENVESGNNTQQQEIIENNNGNNDNQNNDDQITVTEEIPIPCQNESTWFLVLLSKN